VKAFIFTGPTISPAEARLYLDAEYLPPAAEGDVYRAALQQPQAIGIIDGYFHFMPSIRHKEILWAMSRGVHVFGCASMGALRAAELAAFGMEGVGTIFELYRDGLLEDDDEVALVHGPSETDFLPGSEPMVNVRQTLKEAKRLGIISPETQLTLEKIAKETYYPERNYPSLLSRARRAGLGEADAVRLERWLPEGQVNQKRQDAIAMLQLMHSRLAEGFEPKRVAYSFERTALWELACERASNPDAAAGVSTEKSRMRKEPQITAADRTTSVSESAGHRAADQTSDRGEEAPA